MKIQQFILILDLILTTACSGPDPQHDTGIDSGADGDADTDVDADSDADPDGDSDTGSFFSNVEWRLHDEIESLIYVSWSQEESGQGSIEYRFGDGDWISTPEANLQSGENELLLLGIPYNTDVTFRIISNHSSEPEISEEYSAATGQIPAGFPSFEITVNEGDQWEESGLYLLGSVNAEDGHWTRGDFWIFIIDRQGNLLWTMNTGAPDWTYFVRVSADGSDILWDHATYWSRFDDGAASMIYRMKIDGTIVESYEAPGLHHAFTELPDGSLVWGAAVAEYENLIKLNPDGTSETLFSCRDYYQSISVDEWCQSNTLYYHEESDSFLYSFFTTHSVLQVDHSTGSVLRQFGGLPGSWSFDPADSTFWLQHGVAFTDTGTLLLSSHSAEDSDEGCMREYELDDKTQTLRQIWSYGVGAGTNADFAGEAHRLPSGNTLQNYGTNPIIREVTPEGQTVWEARWQSNGSEGRLIGRTIFINDLYALAP